MGNQLILTHLNYYINILLKFNNIIYNKCINIKYILLGNNFIGLSNHKYLMGYFNVINFNC